MSIRGLSLTAVLLAIVLSLPTRQTCAEEREATVAGIEFFEREVRPLFAKHCYSCHSVKAKKLQAGLLMDSRASLLSGGDSGEAIVPGDAESSLLIEAVRYDSYEMPPKGKLPAKDIEALERWVEMGAPWPKEDAPQSSGGPAEFDLQQRQKDHWVWQKITAPAIPQIADTSWPQDDVDVFILAKLESAGLAPSADADRTALMRRLYFDIIGLPPSPAQVEAFMTDTSPHALERLVDELLRSPHFGERWGRHWLDLVRYAESRGHEFDNDTPNAFQYRDYVIRALNEDVPHDQLVREHIAGDLLATPRTGPGGQSNESILGTGFWFLGEWVHSPVDIRKDEADRFDNMIDVMSKTFLGVTVSCARCHDHKFDAISTADYYSMSGFLQSSDYRQVRFESMEHNRKVASQLETLDASFRRKIEDILKSRRIKPLPQRTPAPQPKALSDAIVVDYRDIPPEHYMQDGYVFGARPRSIGDPFLSTGRVPRIEFAGTSAAVADTFWNGLVSVAEKGIQNRSKLAKLPRSGRTLRTPTFTLTDGNVVCRVRGAGHVVACVDSHRLIAGPLHGQTIVKIDKKQKWVSLKLDRYLGHRLHLEFTPQKDSQLEVVLVAQGATAELRKQFESAEASAAAAVETQAEAALKALGDVASKIALAWASERKKLQAKVMHRSHLAMAMLDGTGEDDHVLIRGNASKPGPIEPRHFLTAVTGNAPMEIARGSGRLELAQQINDPSNPLTSRVIVNRIWHSLMGRGIVPTTDDFGVLGQRPSHPELLDHLATWFLANGRSIKRTIRKIVLSRTYRMSSWTDPSAVAADPKNELWHHRAPKRLEGEAIRDAVLTLSHTLDRTQFGEPIPIHLTEFMSGRGRPSKSGPLDGAGRRSIYTAVRRNFVSPFMLTFDLPTPFSTMGRRNVSNVPAQSLVLMNDPFIVEQAEKWARQAIETEGTVASRIAWMYVAAFARRPTVQEFDAAMAYIQSESNDKDAGESDARLWADFAHVLINTKEFIFLR